MKRTGPYLPRSFVMRSQPLGIALPSHARTVRICPSAKILMLSACASEVDCKPHHTLQKHGDGVKGVN